MNPTRPHIRALAGLAWVIATALQCAAGTGEVRLLNASYDVTREFYKEFNDSFAAYWREKSGQTVVINQSHGGSSKQARSVLDGLETDVVTMNQSLDIDLLSERGRLLPADWARRLPHHSAPFTSTILFVVRKGNPKGIKDWNDLVRPGVSVVIPNPKTSGNGRYSYLAAWGYALRSPGGTEAKAREFVSRLFANVPVLDTGGRGATTTFVQNGIGDVLLTFENEVALTLKESGPQALERIVPSSSIEAELPVAWVDRVVSRHGTEAVARAYLEHLYTEAGQEIGARHHFRPRHPAVLARHREEFPAIPLFGVAEVFQSWASAQKTHFNDGGVFDQIYEKSR